MEHDSLAVAKALGFTRKKELVSYYNEYPDVEQRIHDLKSECINYFKSKLPLIINSEEIKTFRKKFQEKEQQEKQKLLVEKQEAQQEAQQKLFEKFLPPRALPSVLSPHQYDVIEIDDDTLADAESETIAKLEKQLAETKTALKKMEIERNRYRSMYKALKRRYKPIINKLLQHLL
jgi:molecular chaperone GrpE (heat shock protein)